MTHIFVRKAENDWLHRKTRYKSTCNRNAAYNAILVKLIDILNKSQTVRPGLKVMRQDRLVVVPSGKMATCGQTRDDARRVIS